MCARACSAAVLPVESETDELSRLAIDLHDRSNLIMDHRVGLFTKIRDSFSGEAFVNWMVKEKESGTSRAGPCFWRLDWTEARGGVFMHDSCMVAMTAECSCDR